MTLHPPRNAPAALLLIPCILLAATPAHEWRADLATREVANLYPRHGETAAIRCTLTRAGAPYVPESVSASVSTNGVWGDGCPAPATFASNVVTVSWGPELDPGAETLCLRIHVDGIHRPAALLHLGPGGGGSTLPPPGAVIDFAETRYVNEPWATRDELRDATNALVIAAVDLAPYATWQGLDAATNAAAAEVAEVAAALDGKAPASHTHTKSQITDFPAIPAPSSATPRMDGAATAGSSAAYARADHRHPTDTSRAPASHTHTQTDVEGLSDALALSLRAEYSAWAPIRELTSEERELFHAEDPSAAQGDYAVTVEGTPTAVGGAWRIFVGGYQCGVGLVSVDDLVLESVSGTPAFQTVWGYPNIQVATRTKTELPGYVLGSQTDKPLQAAVADIAAIRAGASAGSSAAGELAAIRAAADEIDLPADPTAAELGEAFRQLLQCIQSPHEAIATIRAARHVSAPAEVTREVEP